MILQTNEMQTASRAIFEEWSPPFLLTISMLLVAIVYIRGWSLIRITRPSIFQVWRLSSFLLGMSILWIAIASPLDGFADVLLSAHMIEHLLLMSFVPPLLLLGQPVVPMLRGLPTAFTRLVLGPVIRVRFLRRLGSWLTTPLIAWFAMNLCFLGWHIPKAYDFALEHEGWHDLEHICFLASSILFWWPLVRPWPTHTPTLGWLLLPYLILADIVNTALSAFLAFCDRPVYLYYLEKPNGFTLDPMTDQRAGAAAMWVIGSIVFLLPAVVLTFKLLQKQETGRIRTSDIETTRH